MEKEELPSGSSCVSPPAPHFPACFVEIPATTQCRRAAFYLAAEEYVAAHLPEDDYLFSWQLKETVVMGRNQVAHQEVNLDFCQKKGIDVVRRKSGGGTIFADRNNIMWSLITRGGAVEPLFEEYANHVAWALNELGADVTVSGRNDIVLKSGGKVCGNAFYHLPKRNIVHGTMLYDSNLEMMERALRPSVGKLASKGVKSVRSRVALLKEFLPFGIDELRERLRPLLCDRSVSLTETDVKAIEQIEKSYYEVSYIYGQPTKSDVSLAHHFEGCGTIHWAFKLRGTLIEGVTLSGDYFEIEDAQRAFNRAFKGTPFTADALIEAVREIHPEQSIRSLTEEVLTKWLACEFDV